MKSVFISSTAKDLGEHRAAVKAAIERLDLRPIDMRNFGSQPGGAVGVSVREVGKADIYVGILAKRYGYVPDGMTKSVTEQEYDEAIRLRLPRLMYLLDETHPWDAALVEDDPLAQERLKAFKNRVNANEVRSLFTTPDNLAQQVTADLAKLLDQHQERLINRLRLKRLGLARVAFRERRQTLMTRILVAVLGVIGLIALVLAADVEIRDQAFRFVGIVSPTPTPTATHTPTRTPTSTPMPTATPPEGTAFADDAVGVVLADFTNDEPGLNNLGDPLALAFEQQNIPYIRVRHTLANREEAQQVSDLYNATIVVWGEKYATGVQVNYEIDPPRGEIGTTVDNLLIAVDQDFSTFVINEGMGVPYLVSFTQGQMLYFEADDAAALDAFNRAVQDIPVGREDEAQAAALFFYRANIYADLSRHDEALADYTRALELDPNYAVAYYNRGNSYAAQDRLPEALADFNRALELDPGSATAYINRGIVHSYLGSDEEALADFNQALELDSGLALAYANRGAIYLAQDRLTEALADFNRALELDPTDINTYNNRAIAYFLLNQYELSIADYRSLERLTGTLSDSAQSRILLMETFLTQAAP